mgnify:CR=1 FL=1
MNLPLSSLSLVGALALLGLSACAPPPAGPVVASSASQPGYAQGYPQALSASVETSLRLERAIKQLPEVVSVVTRTGSPELVASVRAAMADASLDGSLDVFTATRRLKDLGAYKARGDEVTARSFAANCRDRLLRIYRAWYEAVGVAELLITVEVTNAVAPEE